MAGHAFPERRSGRCEPGRNLADQASALFRGCRAAVLQPCGLPREIEALDSSGFRLRPGCSALRRKAFGRCASYGCQATRRLSAVPQRRRTATPPSLPALPQRAAHRQAWRSSRQNAIDVPLALEVRQPSLDSVPSTCGCARDRSTRAFIDRAVCLVCAQSCERDRIVQVARRDLSAHSRSFPLPDLRLVV